MPMYFFFKKALQKAARWST